MRHNIRPFVTVHKNRWSKSRKSSLWGARLLEEADAPANGSAVPPLQERYPASTTSLFSSGQVGEAPSAAPTGRILPCLLEIASQKEPPDNVRQVRATKRRKAVDTKALQPGVTERPVAEVEVATKQGPLPPRRVSRIQDRWVRKTELRPGERWKRRLCDAAR